MKLLLISNSTNFGEPYLHHCRAAMADFVKAGGGSRILFIPYALHDVVGYTAAAREALGGVGLSVVAPHEDAYDKGALGAVDAVFVGGGNTFRLLSKLYSSGLYDALCEAVANGLPYMGASAGSNVACPTISTTNDMPIVEPPTFKALGLIPYQINPHYLDPVPNLKHMGETREKRLEEYTEENQTSVLGIREGCWILVEESNHTLVGTKAARLFHQGEPPMELEPGLLNELIPELALEGAR